MSDQKDDPVTWDVPPWIEEKQVKEYLWNEKTKKFEPYSFRIEDHDDTT